MSGDSVRVLVWEQADRETFRTAIAGALAVRPVDLELDVDERGKPFVRRPETDLRFSITHARGLHGLALARSRDVGLDAERLDRDIRGWALWRHLLSKRELDALKREGGSPLHAWVRREALLKAAGVGLGLDPATIELSADGEILALPGALGEPEAWSLQDIFVPGYAVAVAHRSTGTARSTLQ